MSYHFHHELSRIWEKSVSLYRDGNIDFASFPIDNEHALLTTWGISKIDVFDYAEDWCIYEEPDMLTFILIHYERWSYFSEVQNFMPSVSLLDPCSLPEKSETVNGISWLPRILPKARAKLKGELTAEVMYGCGGDRQFFKENNVHPAKFLRVVRQFEDNDQAIIEWVSDQKHINP